MVWMMNYQCLTHPTKEAHPSQRVHNGDRIIAVNGLDESIEMMMLGGGVGDSFFSYRFSQYPLGIKTCHIPKVVGKMIFLFQTVGYFSSIFPFHHETAFLEIQPERCLRFDLHILMSLYVENIGWLSLYYLLTDNSSGKAGGAEKSQTLGIIDHSQVLSAPSCTDPNTLSWKAPNCITAQNCSKHARNKSNPQNFPRNCWKTLENATQQNCSLRDLKEDLRWQEPNASSPTFGPCFFLSIGLIRWLPQDLWNEREATSLFAPRRQSATQYKQVSKRVDWIPTVYI